MCSLLLGALYFVTECETAHRAITVAPDLAIRDNACPTADKPKMCTDEVTLKGSPTTLTYICPQATSTKDRETIIVTVTVTDTVQAVPAATGSSAAGSPATRYVSSIHAFL